MINEIKINPEYSSLVSPLSKLEYQVLRESIKSKGLHLPIIINQYNVILDGHNRYKICNELNIEARYEVKTFEDLLEQKEFVIGINLQRRQLNDFQKAELAYKLKEIESEKARIRKLSKLKDVKNTLPLPSIEVKGENGETADIVSRNVGISRGTFERAEKIIKNGSEEIKEKLRQGKSNIFKEYTKIERDRKRQEIMSQIHTESSKKEKDKTDNYELILGDFIEKGKDIEKNSIDLIFTDPPYSIEALSLYKELARLSVRVLKSGGSIVTFVGHIIMDEVIEIFNEYSLKNDTGLKYWWIFAVKHSGNHTKIHARNVFAEWKPMLWYVKGKRINNLAISNTIGDHIQSAPPNKTYHKWEQSTVEVEYVIKNLTLENQTVFDPMVGTGTTGIAALNLKRKFIGIEKDKETYDIAKARIGRFLKAEKR